VGAGGGGGGRGAGGGGAAWLVSGWGSSRVAVWGGDARRGGGGICKGGGTVGEIGSGGYLLQYAKKEIRFRDHLPPRKCACLRAHRLQSTVQFQYEGGSGGTKQCPTVITPALGVGRAVVRVARKALSSRQVEFTRDKRNRNL